MINHISARVAWHMDGWDGHICKKPKENTYCVGQYSYPGDMIGERRDLEWEMKKKIAGNACTKLDKIPPCIYSINAFGKDKLKAFADPPVWFRDGSKTKYWALPPATTCVWPYEEMYTDEVRNSEGSGQTFNYDKRLERAKQYFSNLTSDKSLIIYYSNYSNPFSEDETMKYVIVGISRIKSIGKVMFYEESSEETKNKYGGGFVWQLPITSHYPDQGLRLPYHLYIDDPHKIEKLLFVPENDRNFKYATRIISDDDAIDIIEHLIEIVDNLIKLKDSSENWAIRKEWLQSLIAELWQNRGAYPGLPKILNYLHFQEAIQFFKDAVKSNQEEMAKSDIFSFLNGKSKIIKGLKLTDTTVKTIQRQWKLQGKDKCRLLSDVFPRIDFSKEQIEKIISEERDSNGIYADVNQILDNPYIISEQFIGNGPDDRISFNKIDHAMLPSPELETKYLAEKDDWRRLRALCAERLKKESQHTFIAASKVIHDINHKLSFFPEWKRHQFTENYFDVDKEELSNALTFREEDGKNYLYLKTVFEDERDIETQIRQLIKRPNIKLKFPLSEKNWNAYLYEESSPLAVKNPKKYEEAIKGQIAVCQKIFTTPVCIISGAAGTGKTTIIKAIIHAIEKAHGSGTSFMLLAPTGKAADRIREKTNKDASTIHSFLAQRGWLNDNLTFKRRGGNQEAGISTYIVDEASMLDLDLAAALFRAINWPTVQRLIFVGDPNQLPPIGKGKVFADLIEWLNKHNPDAIGKLHINIRQMENRLTERGTGILDLASLYIRENYQSDDQSKHKSDAEKILKKVQEGGDLDKDLRVIYWANYGELEKVLINTIISDLQDDTKEHIDKEKPYELWSKAFKAEDGSQRADYQQVISPYRGELFGIENLNLVLQKFVNQHNVEKKGTLGGITFFDKVIQYKNRPKSNPYYAYRRSTGKIEKVEIYNGEIGFVKPHAFDKKWFYDGNIIRRFQVIFSRKNDYWIEFSSESQVAENLELAYAISVHKAQGSEFERVYFVLPKSKKSLLSTELLYTGITRAQRHLTLFVEDDISPLLSLRRPEKSKLLSINSSLFEFKPIPDELLALSVWYEEGKIHHTLSEYMVRSKSEVIIANMLSERKIPFRYEVPLFASDGTFYLPDFTVTWNGEEWYWEHLGLMEIEEYKNHWETKKAWYDQHFKGKLITTKESNKLSKDATKTIQKYFKK